jgi:ribosomal protein L11 methyltransferase
VPRARLEQARARFVELAPEGFEEVDLDANVELAAYGEAAERVRAAFPQAESREVEPGWEERWRAFHRPVRIGPLWVGPPWEPPAPGSLAVVVDPGRAFGTGAHPTTRLCLELLLEQPRGSVVDVGCGSGVLAIAAAKLGHAPVLALDVDEAAVEAARENAAANGVSLEVRRLDALAAPVPPAELALANIALTAVAALERRLEVSRLVASGYLAVDEPALERLRRLERRELEGWAADLYERRHERR